jgi:hypothetical protein
LKLLPTVDGLVVFKKIRRIKFAISKSDLPRKIYTNIESVKRTKF